MRLTVDEAYKKYADCVFRAAFNVCQNQADADDVVQDTFIKYHSWKKEFSDEEHIKAWLLKVAINRARDIRTSFWRKNKVTWEDYMEEITKILHSREGTVKSQLSRGRLLLKQMLKEEWDYDE